MVLSSASSQSESSASESSLSSVSPSSLSSIGTSSSSTMESSTSLSSNSSSTTLSSDSSSSAIEWSSSSTSSLSSDSSVSESSMSESSVHSSTSSNSSSSSSTTLSSDSSASSDSSNSSSSTTLSSPSSNSSSSTTLSSTSSNSSSSSSSSTNQGSGMIFENVINFLSADQTIAINATTNVVSVHKNYGNATACFDVRGIERGRLFLYAKGSNAGCSKDVIFYFQVSPDKTHWCDEYTVRVRLNGTSPISSANTTLSIDLHNTNYIRLMRIQNTEVDNGYTAVVNACMQIF